MGATGWIGVMVLLLGCGKDEKVLTLEDVGFTARHLAVPWCRA